MRIMLERSFRLSSLLDARAEVLHWQWLTYTALESVDSILTYLGRYLLRSTGQTVMYAYGHTESTSAIAP